MSDQTVLNLFVSSPGDVQRERERIDFIVERLNAEYQGRARIRTIRWETQYYSSHDTFQAQIPEASDCDLVLAIFGARLGSPLPAGFPAMASGERYPSGSAYEVLTAIEARRRGQGTPDIYVFRRPSAPFVALDAPDRDEIDAQWRRLKVFFETWFRTRSGEFIAAFQEFATTDEFAIKVEDCLRQWLTRRGFPPKSSTWDRVKLGSPYPGLASFDASRQSVFFGRELVIDQAIRRLRELEAPAHEGGREPFLLLIGASGSGKSSLLRAGLLPKVSLPGVLPEVDLWRRAITTPGVDPFLMLAESLLAPEALGPELSAGPFRARELLAKQLAGDPDAAIAPLRAALEAAAETRRLEAHFEIARPVRLFLVIDQAERLFFETPAALQVVFSTLVAALCRHRLATVVVALRSDAYARFQALDALVALRDAGATLDLLPATPSELEEMATRPAALCDPALNFERRDGRSLSAVLVADARGGDALPLLQMSLARLSAAEAARGDGVLRYADYRGLAEAVSETANEALTALDPAARAQLPQLIVGLVRDFVSDPLTGKAIAAIGALDRGRFEADRPERKALIEAFVVKRLLTAEGDAASQRVRPTHESLLRIWPEAVAILEDAGHLIRARAAIEPAAREWVNAPAEDRARHLDISPALLEGAQSYVERFEDQVDPAVRRFVAEATVVATARRERERLDAERRLADAQAIARANSRIARAIGVGLVAALALAGVAGWQWREAQTQSDRATRAITAAIATADTLVFDIGQKFRDLAGVPKPVLKDILEQARGLQEQLLKSGESSNKLTSNHAAALGELAVTELTLGDAPAAFTYAEQSREIYAKIVAGAPDDVRFLHDLAYCDETIADVLQRQGKFEEAAAAYKRALVSVEAARARGVNDQRLRQDKTLIVEGLASLAYLKGDMEEADRRFREGLELAQGLAKEAPDDLAARHELAVAHRSLGDLLLRKGEVDAAAAEFKPAAEIALVLANQNPTNSLLQRDYTLSQERLGETLIAKKDFKGALEAFSLGEATAIVSAASDPANLQYQSDISIGHIEVGDAQVALGDFAGAAKSFREAVAIDKSLTGKDATNTMWRDHYGDSLERLGGVLGMLALWPEALAVYRDAQTFTDDAHVRGVGDEGKLYEARIIGKTGDALDALGKSDEALAAFSDALGRARALGQSRAAQDLTFSLLTRIGGLHAVKGDANSSLKAYGEAEVLLRSFINADAKDWGSRGQLATLLIGKSHMQTKVGRPNDAVASLREALALATALAAERPNEVIWVKEQVIGYDRLADVLRSQGDALDAIDSYRRSVELAKSIPPSRRAEVGLQTEAAVTDESLGLLLEEQKNVDAALGPMNDALTQRKAEADAAPDDTLKLRALYYDENNVARMLLAVGKTDEALDKYRDALAIARRLAERPGAGIDARNELAISLFFFGSTLTRKGDSRAAGAAYGEAEPILQKLAAEAPANIQHEQMLGFVTIDLGDALAAQGERAGALKAYVRARDLAKAILARGAPNANASLQLKMNVGRIGILANAMLLASDFSGALAALDEATPATPDQNWLDLVRAAALMFLDRPDEARSLYQKHRGETTFGDKSWDAATLEGFAMLRKQGLEKPLMKEIEADLAAAK